MDLKTDAIVNTLFNEGIIGFDAATTVIGRAPEMESNLLPYDIKMKQQPQKDAYSKEDKSLTIVNNPTWKKVLLGAITIAGLAYGGYKFKSSLLPLIQKGYNKIIGFFKKKPPTPPTPTP